MFEALQKAALKPDSDLRVLFVGTLAPAAPDTWWPRMVAKGNSGSTHVTALQGSRKGWDSWPVIKKSNPLLWTYPASRRGLLEERDEARSDPRLRASFLRYRLNVLAQDEDHVLLTTSDYRKMCARPVPPRAGQPILGFDVGSNRAWTSLVAVWPNLRTECWALTAGIPDLAEQERRDGVGRGAYRALADSGRLIVDEGRHIPRVELLKDIVGCLNHRVGFCDRWRVHELADAGIGRIVPRLPRWKESTEDIKSLRRLAKDDELSVEVTSRPLLKHSLSVTRVIHDDGGNTRIRKSKENKSRDDVSVALVAAAAGHARLPARPKRASFSVVG